MPSYFASDTSFLNTMYSLDIAVESYLKNLVFPEDAGLERIIYASNDFTFRKRARENEGNLNLPYLNYHVKQSGFQFNNDFSWRNTSAYSDGIFFPELGAKVKIMPVIYEYECTFWCNRDDEAKYTSLNVSFDQGSTSNPIEYSVSVNNVEIPLLGKLFFDSNDLDGNYVEKDWFERNNIHSVGMDFNVKTYILKSDFDVCIPITLIYEFTNAHEITEDYTDDERYNFTIDHFNEEVTVDET